MKAIEALIPGLGTVKTGEERATKPADMGELYVAKKTVVVYNPLNLEAVITAAVLKDKFANYKVVPAGSHIDEGADTYIWLGVKDNTHLKRVLKIHKAQHQTYLTGDVAAADETGYRPPMMERVCLDHGISMGHRLIKTAFHVTRFYDRSTPLADLQYVFGELRHSMSVLGLPALQETYMEAMEQAKQQLGSGYQISKALDGSSVVKVMVSNIHDTGFALALRLIKLRGIPFVNYSNGVNGSMIYTDLNRPHLEEHGTKMVLMMN